jgi:class 3 adenylate cyclase
LTGAVTARENVGWVSGGMPSSLCASCGHANREGVRFCENCGELLALRCGSCGAELPPSARFCGSCGAAVGGEVSSGADGSLKVVSVVFGDLVGSTALQESLDAESVRRVMARFYEVMSGAVARHGGHVEKFVGDGVVAVFGVPAVREDDGLRAVRCAASMVSDLALLGDELERTWGVRLGMRAAVNTGELVVGGEDDEHGGAPGAGRESG